MALTEAQHLTPSERLIIALLSPYHGGSHAAWAAGYQATSRHDVQLLTLPARFWKWRMHGGAVTLAEAFRRDGMQPDVILATDMLDLTTFLALTRGQTAVIPTALYMHENQLTYPLPADGRIGPMRRQQGERDLHYAFINYAAMLAADCVLFNSTYHRESWLASLPTFLKHFPEYQLLDTIAALQAKSHVLPVGLRLDDLQPPNEPPSAADSPPLILWNQRWEYDKNPEAFFAALYALAEEGLAFEVALCGEMFGKRPLIFQEALDRLHGRLIHVGYASRERYRELLWQATITISTAHHEFFGISILEAIACHTFPLLPRRLSYPELIPAAYHPYCLYEDQADLVERLRQALQAPDQLQPVVTELATAVRRFDWPILAPRYDQLLTTLRADFVRQPLRIDV
jgi:glycosyltransferase involved in cell wall biosynthesis